VPLHWTSGTKRTAVVESAASSRADDSDGAPKAVHVLPLSVVYCQVPWLSSTATTAMPSTGPASTSVIRSPPALAMIPLTSVPLLVTSSWSTATSVIVPVLSKTGASFRALTTISAVAVAVLKAVVPPLVELSAVPPLLPLVWSHARKVIPGLTVPFQSALGTKRTLVLASAASRRADDSDGVPKAVHVLPLSVVYCQVPWLLSTAMTAMPSTAPASTSVIRSPSALEMIPLTSVPLLVTLSSSIAASVMIPVLSNTGASFTALTTIRAVSVAVLKAVVPPLVEVLAVSPLLPLVWSQARNVMPGSTVPFQFALGTKRTLVLLLAASSRAAVFEGVPNAYQFVPLLVVYCQVPLALFTAATAIPSTAPASTSVIRSPPALEMIPLTSVPLLVALSSSIAIKDIVPLGSRTGASLRAVTRIEAVS